MDGTAIQPGGSGSGLCLSCHDGATALDLLINAPGSGGYNAAGLSAGYTFTGGTTNKMLSTSIANLGTDLGNDHPVGIPYCGGTVSAACKDSDFFVTALYKNGTVVANPTSAAPTTDNFWVDVVAPAGTRTKGDLPLYVRDFSGTNYAAVECATCHEPHSTSNATFLRMSNTSSNLCRACHNK